MKFLAYGPMLAASALLASESVVPIIPPEMIQGGALGALTWTIWYLMSKVFPAQIAAQKEQRDAFLAHLEKQHDEHDGHKD